MFEGFDTGPSLRSTLTRGDLPPEASSLLAPDDHISRVQGLVELTLLAGHVRCINDFEFKTELVSAGLVMIRAVNVSVTARSWCHPIGKKS